MCSLCGILGGRGHWTESASNPGAFVSRTNSMTVRRERQERTKLANTVLAHYGLKLADWPPSNYILRNAKGRSVLVSNLSELWSVAESVLDEACDPLAESLLSSLSAQGAKDR